MNDQLTRHLLTEIKEKIKLDEIESAETLLQQLLAVHPEGIYARALAESITKIKNSRSVKEVDRTPESPIVVPTPSVPASVPERIIAAKPPRLKQSTVVPPPAPQNTELSTKAEVIIDAWQEGTKIVSAIFTAYKQLLMTVLNDGVITFQEQQQLDELRSNLDITQAQHNALEREVRLEWYLRQVKFEYLRGGKDFSELRSTYGVEREDAVYLESREQEVIQSLESKAVVLLVDDDANSLLLMQRILGSAGYYCRSCSSAEDAIEILAAFIPDLVICDLAFGPSRMNGFTFYTNFRRIASCSHVPFIIVTGVGQDSMVRSAKKMGIDDYLIKPVTSSILLSTAEGKIRRAKDLRIQS